MLNTGKIYLHKILGNILCWTLWEYLFTHNTGKYVMLSTVGRFIYTKYRGILYVERCGKIYLLKILRNIVCWARWEDYLHKTLGITLCWTLLEDLFTHNTEEYFMLSTVGRFIYTKYWGILYVEHTGKIYLHKILKNTSCWTLWKYLFIQNTGDDFMLSTVGKFIYTHYWGILYVEDCGKIYLHKILRNTVCWTHWENLFTQNTEEYCMFNTLGRFIYTRYWVLHYVEHYMQDLVTQNTEEYFMLNTVGRFIYTKYWGILYGEHCGKIYLHKILGITSFWVEHWEYLFTQNNRDYFMVSNVRRFIYTKYWGILYVEHCGKIYLHKILNKAPDELLVQQENFDTDLLDNVNIGPLNEEINFSITQEEILRCIKKLKNNKACGEDYVVNEYIKSTSELFLPTYEKIFNAIFNSGVMPDIWLVGNIKPIYKNKGNPLDPKNFRPITILSCLGKLFTAILNERLCRFSEEALLMNENQFGFRKSYSTTDSFFHIIFVFWDLKKKKEKTVLCLCRLRKGFWHGMERCIMVQITIESHKWQNVYYYSKYVHRC